MATNPAVVRGLSPSFSLLLGGRISHSYDLRHPAIPLCAHPSLGHTISLSCYHASGVAGPLRPLSHRRLKLRLQRRLCATGSERKTAAIEASSSVQKPAVPSYSSTGNGTLTTGSGDLPKAMNGQSRASGSRGSRAAGRRPPWLERNGTLWEEEIMAKAPRSLTEYLLGAKDWNTHLDGGPPRWFCSLGARPSTSDLPVIFFVPGIDGTGLGLLQQEESLARFFELRCLHIPISDRTPFDGLVDLVSDSLAEEGQRSPGKPLYVLAESFGACVSLAAAARNPDLFLHLVLVNPATCFERTELKPLLPLLQILPEPLFPIVPFLFSYTMGDPVRMAAAGVDSSLPPQERLQKVANRMTAMIPELPLLGDILPKATLMWKIKLLEDGAPKANAVLKNVKAHVLLLASGKDQMIPSKDEAKRLVRILPRCSARLFSDSGHTLLLEEGVNVMANIKGAGMYKRSKKDEDPVLGFVPPTAEDLQRARSSIETLKRLGSPVYFSTDSEGRVQRGLGALPSSGPLLFVGNHQLIGFDLPFIVDQILREKKILVRGLAHPGALGMNFLPSSEPDPSSDDPMVGQAPDPMGLGDLFRTFGAVPVTGTNMYKLLANGEAALLFPGGVREALKRKGETYKLFWPQRSEFVRMAVRHGATIIPFSVIGVEDSVGILFDSTEVPSIPGIGEDAVKLAQRFPTVRDDGDNADLFISPIIYPKLPSRQYFLFRKPIITEGLKEEGFLEDKERTVELYLHVKSEVEAGLEYLQVKREQDPYKDFLPRIVYETSWGGKQAPTFPLP